MREGCHASCRWRPGRLGFVLIAVALLATSPISLSAQDVVLHRFESKTPEQPLENLLYLAAGVALAQDGLSSTRVAGKAAYLLVTDYAVSGQLVHIQYRLSAASHPELALAALSIDASVDGGINAKIATAIKMLLKSASIQPRFSPDARIEDLLPTPSPAPQVTLPTAPPEKSHVQTVPPAALPAPRVAPSHPSPETPPPAAAKPAANGSAAPGKQEPKSGEQHIPMKFSASFSVQGALFFGALTEFIHYGLGGRLRAELFWPMYPIGFGTGVEVSIIRAFDDIHVNGGPLFVSTAGPFLAIGSQSAGGFSWSASASGGAAFVTTVAATLLTKTDPYAEITLRAAAPLGHTRKHGASNVPESTSPDNVGAISTRTL